MVEKMDRVREVCKANIDHFRVSTAQPDCTKPQKRHLHSFN